MIEFILSGISMKNHGLKITSGFSWFFFNKYSRPKYILLHSLNNLMFMVALRDLRLLGWINVVSIIKDAHLVTVHPNKGSNQDWQFLRYLYISLSYPSFNLQCSCSHLFLHANSWHQFPEKVMQDDKCYRDSQDVRQCRCSRLVMPVDISLERPFE